MTVRERKKFSLEEAVLDWRNFEGREGLYNEPGQRSFKVILPDELAQELLDDGWNVRTKVSEDPDIPPRYTLDVAVTFDRRPPRIVMMSSAAKVVLDEEKVAMLDWADIESADLTVNGHEYAPAGHPRVKAYLQSLYVTIQDDPIRRKYEDY